MPHAIFQERERNFVFIRNVCLFGIQQRKISSVFANADEKTFFKRTHIENGL